MIILFFAEWYGLRWYTDVDEISDCNNDDGYLERDYDGNYFRLYILWELL